MSIFNYSCSRKEFILFNYQMNTINFEGFLIIFPFAFFTFFNFDYLLLNVYGFLVTFSRFGHLMESVSADLSFFVFIISSENICKSTIQNSNNRTIPILIHILYKPWRFDAHIPTFSRISASAIFIFLSIRR